MEKNSLFIISVGGILERKALVILKNLSRLKAVKMDRPIFHVEGSINGWIAILFARSY